MSELGLPNLSLQVNQDCNLACEHCDFQKHLREHANERPVHISTEFFSSVVDEYRHLQQREPKSLSLAAGAEALMHPRFLDLCECANQSGISFGFDTNASLLTPDVSYKLLQMPQLKRIVFSIDSLDPEIYAAIRRGGNLEEVNRNVHGFLRLAKEIGRDDVYTRVNMVVQKRNRHELRDLIKFWTSRVNQVNATQQRVGGKVPQMNWMPAEREPCRFLWNHMRVLTDGSVVVCCIDDEFTSVIGDIKNTSLADVWRGPEYEELRAKQKAGDFDRPAICRECQSWAGFYPPRRYRFMLPHIVLGERPMNTIAMSLPLGPRAMTEYLRNLWKNKYRGKVS